MKKIKKTLALLTTSLLAACAAPTTNIPGTTTANNATNTGAQTSVLAKVQSTKKLVIGTSADFPPFEWHMVKDGKDTIVGFDISIAQEIAKDLGAELVVEDMNFDSLIAAVKTGKVDMVMAGMNPTAERAQEVDFSSIYYQTGVGVLVKKTDVEKITTLEQLGSLNVGVQKGTLPEELVKKSIPTANLTSMPKNDALVLALKTGRLDAVAVDKVVAENFAKVNTDIVLSQTIQFDQADNGSAIAIAKNNTDFVEAVNKTLARLASEGKIKEFMVTNSNLMNAE